MLLNIIFLILCSGVVGAYLSKTERSPGDNVILVVNLLAVLTNAITLALKLNAPVA